MGGPVVRDTATVHLPAPHSASAAHFTAPFYDDPALETAPFGSDEGSDILWEWGKRRDELGPKSDIADIVADVMEADAASLANVVEQMASRNYLDEAAIVRGAAFTLLRLIGHLLEEDREIALRCIEYEIKIYADPGWLSEEARVDLLPPLQVQRADLRSWRNPEN